jgi:hypothetical protein
MSHWAEIDNNNIVLRILVGDNNSPDEGYQWIMDNLGGTWIQTSYNGNVRYNYAGIGYSYDALADAFIPPKPKCGHTELALDTNVYQWVCENAEHEALPI